MCGNQPRDPGPQAHSEDRNFSIALAFQPADEFSSITYGLPYGLDRSTKVGAQQECNEPGRLRSK